MRKTIRVVSLLIMIFMSASLVGAANSAVPQKGAAPTGQLQKGDLLPVAVSGAWSTPSTSWQASCR